MKFGKFYQLHTNEQPKVKENKINMLVHKIELFHMGKGESIGEMHVNFSNIILGLKALENEIPMKEQVAKILRSLTDKYKRWLLLRKLWISQHLKWRILLETYEIKILAREQEDGYSTKKAMTFQAANSSESEDTTSNDEGAFYIYRGKYKN